MPFNCYFYEIANNDNECMFHSGYRIRLTKIEADDF